MDDPTNGPTCYMYYRAQICKTYFPASKTICENRNDFWFTADNQMCLEKEVGQGATWQ